MSRILVIDDAKDVSALVKAVLEKGGHEVVMLPDGRDAVKIVDKQPIDLVITDLSMPEQDGLETIRKLRRAQPEIRIILMTGGVAPNLARRIPDRQMKGDTMEEALGVVAILWKPFRRRQLLELVTRVTGSPSNPAHC